MRAAAFGTGGAEMVAAVSADWRVAAWTWAGSAGRMLTTAARPRVIGAMMNRCFNFVSFFERLRVTRDR